MAEDTMIPEVEAAMAEGGIPKPPSQKEPEYVPSYRVMGDKKIAVSKATGKLWQARRDNAKSSRTDAEEAWREAVRYYNNDQMKHRNTTEGGSGNRVATGRLNEQHTETENVVFSNAVTMLPILYAKNPGCEITATSEANAGYARCCELLLKSLSSMKEAPGINLKPKARRGVLTALLTNRAWLKIGWTFKDASSEQAMQDLQKLAQELEKAKDINEIREIEGKIMALESQISLLTPEGPTAKVLSPFNILVDPEASEADCSDANWVMECDMLPTAYLKARYLKQDAQGNYVSVFEPTHVMKLSGQKAGGVEEDVNNFTLSLGDDGEKSLYGYADEDVYEKSQMTKVWYVYDKTTRRIYMFHDKDWTWPIWVWEDPYKLLGFFPFIPLWFHETVDGQDPKGEVTYYLDQQDAINEINDELRRARRWMKRNVFFNKNAIGKDDVEAVLKGVDGTARGIDVPEGQKLQDVIGSVPPPALRFAELFDPASKFAAINRITGIGDIMKGGQFKTNTTNDQVQQYANYAQIRTEEKTDLIEDWLGAFFWNLLQLCVQFMSKEQVAAIIGAEAAAEWKNFSPEELRTSFNMRVVGGSTSKPTSQIKKKEALEMGQVLGQFVQASPAVIMVLLKVFEQAFDEVVIKQEDWQFIMESVQMNMQKAGAGPGAGGNMPEGGAPEGDMKQQLIAALQKLPPEAKQAVEQLVQQGMPPEEALKQVMQQMQQQM